MQTTAGATSSKMLTSVIERASPVLSKGKLTKLLEGYIDMKKVKEIEEKTNPVSYSLQDAYSIIRAHRAGRWEHNKLVLNVQLNMENAQNGVVRGTIQLPNRIIDNLKIVVFANPEFAKIALEAGASMVGTDDLVQLILEEKIQFDRCIAMTDMMPTLTKVARYLGPKGLMPNIKSGTLTDDISGALKNAVNCVNFRSCEHGVLNLPFARASFSFDQVLDNYSIVMNTINAFAKPKKLSNKTKELVTKHFISVPGICVPMDGFKFE